MWVVPSAAALQVVMYGWRVAHGERDAALVMLVLSVLLVAAGMLVVLTQPRTALVLTEDALLLERRWRPVRVPRADVLAVDGSIRGRPSWSEYAVLTVRDDAGPPGAVRTVRVGVGLDVHARVLIPRLQEWAGVGAPPDEVPPGR
jgi:hypothetical protein